MYIRLSLITDYQRPPVLRGLPQGPSPRFKDCSSPEMMLTSSLLPKPQRLAFGAAIAEFNVIFSVVTRVKTR